MHEYCCSFNFCICSFHNFSCLIKTTTKQLRRLNILFFNVIFLGSKAKHKRKLADDNETDDLADEDYDDMDDLNIDAGEYDLADEQQAENDVSEMETEMLDCV